MYRKAIDIRETALPHDHPYRAKVLEDYAALLRKIGRDPEAAELETRAREVRETHTANEAAS